VIDGGCREIHLRGKSGVVSKSSPFPATGQPSLDDLAAYRLLVTAAFGVGWSNAAPRYLGYTKRTVQRWLRGDRAMPYRAIRTLEDKLLQRIASLPALEAEERRLAEERCQVLASARTVARLRGCWCSEDRSIGAPGGMQGARQGGL
jgi:hypothetical protein